eukprot:TRINITY_DN8587_c0_g1_i1.p1 TRINITY_DN8587_c0_g1~~TRINITY_DN8587_c0_g1_i1.p1  ORF type:complete len:521 (+),score=155.54 TRINITY_DN8587_c0_g1_i1:41-1603(+)
MNWKRIVLVLILCGLAMIPFGLLSRSNCDADITWTEWSPWGPCTKQLHTCSKVRFRGCRCGDMKVIDPAHCEKYLGGDYYEELECLESECLQRKSEDAPLGEERTPLLKEENTEREEMMEQPPKEELGGKEEIERKEQSDAKEENKVEEGEGDVEGDEGMEELLIMEIPAYGPNNQYIGMKETMLIARTINRTFAVPDFLAHQSGSIRTFESTFEREPMNEYVKTTTLSHFINKCANKIDLLVWMRWEGPHRNFVDSYLSSFDLHYEEESFVSKDLEREERPWKSYEEIRNFFSEHKDKKCIALACPFRNIWFAEKERQDIAKYVYHSKEIQQKALKALTEMGVEKENLISYHWRFGEDSCAVYQVEGLDFCWGTSIFSWAKLDDALYILNDLLNKTTSQKSNKILYLSISNTFNPTSTLEKLSQGLALTNTKIMRSTMVPSLNAITDNYQLSLIEQEICGLSSLFIASSFSTWSDYIVDYKTVNQGQVYSMDDLFHQYNKPFQQLNLFEERAKAKHNKH